MLKQKNKLTAIVFVFIIGIACTASALELDTLKMYYMRGDYKAAITEGEKALSHAGSNDGLDELYYILGLSYLKDGNYLRASDIFEIIIKEFKSSKYKEDAKLGLGDVAFLSGDLKKAQNIYEEILDDDAHTKLRAKVYSRLALVAFKNGETEKGKEYRKKLSDGFPASNEDTDDGILASTDSKGEFCYTVQAGSFSNRRNAENLTSILIKKNYPAFVEEGLSLKSVKIYRVKVGRIKTRQEALVLEERLAREGYPTKVVP